MKNLSLALNVVLLIAVAVLYFLHFSSPKAGGTNNQSGDAAKISGEPKNSTIVYVNMDSLQHNYKFYIDIEDQITSKQKGAQSELAEKSKAFQEKYDSYTIKAKKGFLTSRQRTEMEKQLALEQQELQRLEYEMSNHLMNQQATMTQDLYDSITSYLNDYNVQYGYQYILGYSAASSILLADEGLDITQVVIEGLNARYEGKNK